MMTSWIRISGILHFEQVSSGISADTKLQSLHTENHFRVWNVKRVNSHEKANQQISSPVFSWPSCWLAEEGVGRKGTKTAFNDCE